MLALIVGLWANPIARKVAVAGAVMLAIFFAFRRWLVSHDEAVRRQERITVTDEIEATRKTEWDKREAAIAADAARVASDRKALDAGRAEVARSREALNETLHKRLEEIQAGAEAGRVGVLALAGSDVDGAIRAELAANLKAGASAAHR